MDEACSSLSDDMKRVRILMSGKRFECYKKTLLSKKGSIFRDEELMKKFYDKETREYVFWRDQHAFEAIFVYLQCGALVKPEKVTFKTFIEELTFFGFKEIASNLFNGEMEKYQGEKEESEDPTGKNRLRLYLYDVVERPEKSKTARIFATLSSFTVFLSITVYCLSSYPGLSADTIENIHIIEAVCNIWFTLELVLRFALSYEKKRFFKKFINIVDLLSILPFYIEQSVGGDNSNYVALATLRVLRITRIFRILKVSRYSVGMHIVFLTLKQSLSELAILLFFIFMMMIFFASLIYQCESEQSVPSEKIKSIPHAFWLVIVTITTVGYGDVVPETAGGQVVTSMLAVTGIILLSLPIPIVVNNFRDIYVRLVEKRDEYFFDFDELSERILAEINDKVEEKNSLKECNISGIVTRLQTAV